MEHHEPWTAMNDAILRLPQVHRLLVSWWDEERAFAQGHSAAVLADRLEELGWDDSEEWRDYLPWLRENEGRRLPPTDMLGLFVPVFHIASSTLARAAIRGLVNWGMTELVKHESRDDIARIGRIALRSESLLSMALSAELRDIMQWIEPSAIRLDWGVPVRLHLLITEHDQNMLRGHVEFRCRNTRIIGRVYD